MLVFEDRAKTEIPGEKLSEQRREPSTNRTRMAFMPGFEPRPHWCEASALTTATSLFPN